MTAPHQAWSPTAATRTPIGPWRRRRRASVPAPDAERSRQTGGPPLHGDVAELASVTLLAVTVGWPARVVLGQGQGAVVRAAEAPTVLQALADCRSRPARDGARRGGSAGSSRGWWDPWPGRAGRLPVRWRSRPAAAGPLGRHDPGQTPTAPGGGVTGEVLQEHREIEVGAGSQRTSRPLVELSGVQPPGGPVLPESGHRPLPLAVADPRRDGKVPQRLQTLTCF